VICGNLCLTVRDIAVDVGISIVSCHQILTEKLHMCFFSAKYVLCLLIVDQEENRDEISQEVLANASGKENFVKKIKTGYDMWVYGYDIEIKMDVL